LLETKIFRLSEGNQGTRRPDPAKAPKTKLTQMNVATLFGLHAPTVALWQSRTSSDEALHMRNQVEHGSWVLSLNTPASVK
jgi:hypothetical protein